MNFGQRGTFHIVKKKEGILKLFDSFRIEFGAYGEANILKSYTVEKHKLSDSFKASGVFSGDGNCEINNSYEVTKKIVSDSYKTSKEFPFSGKGEVINT